MDMEFKHERPYLVTFVKTVAVFSTVCHVLLYTAISAFVYQLPHIFPALRGQCKKLKHGTVAWLYPRLVRGLGAWLTHWYIILIGR